MQPLPPLCSGPPLCKAAAFTTLTEAAREEDRPVNKMKPAMAAGLAEKPWNVSDLLNAIAV